MDSTNESSSVGCTAARHVSKLVQRWQTKQRHLVDSKLLRQMIGRDHALSVLVAISFVFSALICGLTIQVSAATVNELPMARHANADDQRAMEAELNSIVQQHEGPDGNNKQLAEAIISRFMLDNLTGAGLSSLKGDLMDNDISSDLSGELMSGSPYNQQQPQQQVSSYEMQSMGGPEALRSRKLLSLWQNYGPVLSGSGGMTMVPFPELPAGEAATMKRTVNYLQQQQQQRHHYGPRNNYDFGLGKRPDSGVKGNILRFGDGPLGGQVQPVGQFGKRPSAHRFDFGLGKRVASPTYPRYDFGLGKRAPNRIRYDFGLGK